MFNAVNADPSRCMTHAHNEVCMNFLPTTLPQLLLLLAVACLAAWLSELLAQVAPPLGFVGAVLSAFIGAWLFAALPVAQVEAEPTFQDIPLIRSFVGALLVACIYGFYFKRQRRRAYRR